MKKHVRQCFESLEPRQMMALVALAPLAIDDAYGIHEDQVLVGNVITGTTSGGADTSAAAGLPLKLVEVDGQNIGLGDSIATTSGATLAIGADGSFSYDVSSSATLSSRSPTPS